MICFVFFLICVIAKYHEIKIVGVNAYTTCPECIFTISEERTDGHFLPFLSKRISIIAFVSYFLLAADN